ncbi:MAG: polysaccharide deacetylase family protein [Xanthomonadales bacterium]|nr:hypothetical protein [Xanthomonadales bacterium]MCC6591951.1 polysaccharide deacetylase family protein [Xanthomonadales bacterium]MCE7930300.1 hypothetical protein [Xanthomonadales bacterium PRO6]
MRALVLCYHSTNVNGRDYACNDHLALRADLAAIEARGLRILPAADAVREPDAAEPRVALTCDDGCTLDALDFEHPAHGHQDSFLRILREHHAAGGQCVQMASFVIASAQARDELDRKDFLGLRIWHDDWWPAAIASGHLSIESHSYDHNHPSLERSVQRDNRRGDFHVIDNEADAQAEIAQASAAIAVRCGVRPRLFAYPWGQHNRYLAEHWLPAHGPALGLLGAFITGAPQPARFDRWRIPRLVCGEDWRSPAEFEALLDRYLRSGDGHV